jgi:hypothetical protein
LVLLLAATSWADSPKILEIEEHWELRVGEPDAERSAPQATMVVSPYDDLDGAFFVFTLNHRSVPAYSPGGMQLQLWDGESAVEVAHGSAVGALDQTNDVVRWVERLKIDNGVLSFEVVDGSSTSWGAFGNDGSLRITTPSSLEGLNGYRPAISLTVSQVGYAGNRVQSLILTKLVWHTDDGEVHQLEAPIDIDADLDP